MAVLSLRPRAGSVHLLCRARLQSSEFPRLTALARLDKPMFFSGTAIAVPLEPPNVCMRLCRKIPPEGSKTMEKKFEAELQETESCCEEPKILEEIQVEELAIDGICGVY
jgi:mycofactocin precursor